MTQRVTCAPYVVEGHAQQLCFHDQNGDGNFQVGQDFVSNNPQDSGPSPEAQQALEALVRQPSFQIPPFVRFLSHFRRVGEIRRQIEANPGALDLGQRYIDLYVTADAAADEYQTRAQAIRGTSESPMGSDLDRTLDRSRDILIRLINYPEQNLADLIRARNAYYALLHAPVENLRGFATGSYFTGISLPRLETNIRTRLEELLRFSVNSTTDQTILSARLAELQTNFEEALNFVPVIECSALRLRYEAKLHEFQFRQVQLRYNALYARAVQPRLSEREDDLSELVELAHLVSELTRDFETDLLKYPQDQQAQVRTRHEDLVRGLALRGCDLALHYRMRFEVEGIPINLALYFFEQARINPDHPYYSRFHDRAYNFFPTENFYPL